MFYLDEKLHAREGRRHLLSVISLRLIGRVQKTCACVCNHPTSAPPASKQLTSDSRDQRETKY